jgi:FtsP/CotA-like multicopper oxidase with cupredoxin domain
MATIPRTVESIETINRLSRRRFLGALGGAALVGGLATTLDPALAAATWAPTAATGSPFVQPEVLASSGGRLAVKLVAEPAKVPYRSGRRFAYTFNGSTPGPTLRVRPGDRLTITLVNRLGETTNLHTHGLHVSPSGRADNVFVSIPDGGRRTYVYDIPADHKSGTFWYHPHMHGIVAPQVSGGLAGAIVVEDAIDELPELAAATERVLVLSDPAIGSSSNVLDVSMMERMLGREGDAILVNGIEAPTITSRAGALEHWRIVNASPSRYYRLALDGHPFELIATDGGRLAEPRTEDELLLAPGERAEVLVRPHTAGSYHLDTLAYDRGGVGGGRGRRSPSTGQARVATLAVAGSAAPAGIPSALAPADTLALPSATGRRALVLAMAMGPGGTGGGMSNGGEGSFTIDGKSFDHHRTDITTKLGRVEDWTITNASTMDHPFHLHVWPFQIIDRTDGVPIAPGWKDTINVPAGHAVTVRVPILDIDGRTVYHCHILDHEDLGMMGVIQVS